MLNLFKLHNKTSNNSNNNKLTDLHNDKAVIKDFPASVREWNNSIYTFNNNTMSLIPQTNLLTLRLIRGYFNLFNIYLERKLRRTKLLRRLRLLSSHKIFVSNGEFKHTNNKVNITIYTFNKQKYNFLKKIRKRYINMFRKKVIKNKLNRKFYLIKYKGLNYLKKANTNKLIIIKALGIMQRIKNKDTYNKYKYLYSNAYLTKFYIKVIKKSLKRLKIYLFYKQMLYTNKTKFNYTYLQILKNFLQKVYNKNVEFNLVNLKYHYLNSDIFTESMLLKIKKSRKKIKRYLRKLIKKVKVKKVSKYITHEPALTNNFALNYHDSIEKVLENKSERTKTVVLQDIKHKYLTGVRLKASGRLNRRFTASRSLTKIKYKGNLVNVDSSYKGLSTVLLKGNLRSNLQHTKLSSKTRIGSFGLTGWVSGY